jgi:hypothetical protein
MRPSFPSVHLSLSWSETGMRTLLSLLLVSVDSSSDSAGIAWTIGRVDLGDHDPRTAAALVSAVFGLGVAQAVPTERRSGWIAFIRNYTKEPEHPMDTSGPDTF